MNTPQRLHSLDNLRALMMWLGIVLHVSVNHLTTSSAVPWHDRMTTPAADVLMLFIHTFRMPVFFILAGFFVALLVRRRGVQGMLANRSRRLALPFVIFWPLLFAAMAVLSMAFVHQTLRGTWGIDRSLMPPASGLGLNTMHLWFLCLLIGYCVMAAVVAVAWHRVPSRWRLFVEGSFGVIATRAWGFVVLALPLAWIGSHTALGLVASSGSFAPPLAEWMYHGMFFGFGALAHGQHDRLFAHYARRWPMHAVGGLVFFMATLAMFGMVRHTPNALVHPQLPIALAFNGAAWLWSFALIGLAVRYLPRQNAALRYMSDSAYWVYLVHMLGTLGFGAWLCNAPIGAIEKMAINIGLTTLASLASYELLVRRTWVGRLLNPGGPARVIAHPPAASPSPAPMATASQPAPATPAPPRPRSSPW